MTPPTLSPLVLLASLGGCTAAEHEEVSAPVRAPIVPALQNGDFAKGLAGWDVTGAGSSFYLFKDAVAGDRWTVTTFAKVAHGEDITGSISQVFTVPEDAVALRFVVHGGRSHVRLYDGDRVVDDVIGMDDNSARIPVSWDLLEYRGLPLRLAIEDEEKGDWGFISASGFDVIRDVPSPVENLDFSDGLSGWDATGDAAFFSVFRDGLAGGRWTVTTAARSGPHLMDKATGTLSQTLRVPDDAIALRFYVHGGHNAYVRLWDHQVLLASVAGVDSNSVRVPVSWDMVAHRGNVVRLAIEDPSADLNWGFIGTSGFDLVTSRNGP